MAAVRLHDRPFEGNPCHRFGRVVKSLRGIQCDLSAPAEAGQNSSDSTLDFVRRWIRICCGGRGIVATFLICTMEEDIR